MFNNNGDMIFYVTNVNMFLLIFCDSNTREFIRNIAVNSLPIISYNGYVFSSHSHKIKMKMPMSFRQCKRFYH